jgi:tripartite-type tricarboxylate transporter receptor subunit TctC
METMMNRRSAHSALLALLSEALMGPARAQGRAFPHQTVKVIVPFAPGGGADVPMRLLADRLREIWGTAIVLDNRPGANTMIAAQAALGAPRNGHTLLVTTSLTFQLPYLLQGLKLDPSKELTPICPITMEQLVVLTPEASPIRSLKDAVSVARTDPRRIAFGSLGNGSTSNLVQAEMSRQLGVELIHVPYRGSAPVVQAMLGGEIGLALVNYGTAKPHIAAGKLRPIAVTGARRSPFLPDVPTLSESGVVGFESSAWIGMFAPAGVPAPVIQQVSEDVRSALRSPDIIQRYADFGQIAAQMKPDEFRALVDSDVEKSGKMIRAAGIKLDS